MGHSCKKIQNSGRGFCDFLSGKGVRGICPLQADFPDSHSGELAIIDYMMRGGAFDEKGIWKPDNRGLGFWFVTEWINVHGKLHIVVPHREEYLERYMTEDTEKFLAA